MMLWIKIEITDNYIHLIFKVKQYKNAKIANFVYYGKTKVKTINSSFQREKCSWWILIDKVVC